ncbi:MAG: putative Rossmann-fold nucleotide-binding protein [Enterobacterales bacterium]|jgi:predicted Rossmann-fold nucleotide-binding protein
MNKFFMEKLTMNKLTMLSTVLILSLIQSVAFAKPNSADCVSTTDNASYTGPYKGVENNLTTDDFTRDLRCSNAFITDKYPQRFVTIFGSSRIAESNNSGNKEVDAANDKLYQQIYNLSYNWTKKYSSKYPILTGAGPGIMEAGARGAFKAGGPSIGYTTYYGPSTKSGDASIAFWKYPSKGKAKTIITDGLIFSSVAIRESMMVMHSAAMVFAPGGTGTEWEIFQSIEQIKSSQLTPVPIYIVGEKKIHWQSFYNRLDDMVKRGTIKRHEVEALFVHVDDPEDVLKLLAKQLKVN